MYGPCVSETDETSASVTVLNDHWGNLEQIIFYYTIPGYVEFLLFFLDISMT